MSAGLLDSREHARIDWRPIMLRRDHLIVRHPIHVGRSGP
jgi:hypothetical protein